MVPLNSQVEAAVDGIQALGDAPVRVLLQHASTTGGIGTAALDLLKLAAGSDIVGSNIRKKLAILLSTAAQQSALEASQGLAAAVLNVFLKMLLNILNVVQIGLGLGDLSRVLYDLVISRDAELWTVTLLQPTMTLMPSPVSMLFGGSQKFTATVPPGIAGSVVYDWSTTGSNWSTIGWGWKNRSKL